MYTWGICVQLFSQWNLFILTLIRSALENLEMTKNSKNGAFKCCKGSSYGETKHKYRQKSILKNLYEKPLNLEIIPKKIRYKFRCSCKSCSSLLPNELKLMFIAFRLTLMRKYIY